MHDLVHITDTRIILGKLAAGKKHTNRLRNWKRIIIFFSFIVVWKLLTQKRLFEFSRQNSTIKIYAVFCHFWREHSNETYLVVFKQCDLLLWPPHLLWWNIMWASWVQNLVMNNFANRKSLKITGLMKEGTKKKERVLHNFLLDQDFSSCQVKSLP